MFIPSLLRSKTIGCAQVSSFELRGAYILTILSTEKRTMRAQEISSIYLLDVPMLKP